MKTNIIILIATAIMIILCLLIIGITGIIIIIGKIFDKYKYDIQEYLHGIFASDSEENAYKKGYKDGYEKGKNNKGYCNITLFAGVAAASTLTGLLLPVFAAGLL